MQRILQTPIHTSPCGKYCLSRCRFFMGSGMYSYCDRFGNVELHRGLYNRPERLRLCKCEEVKDLKPVSVKYGRPL